MHSLHNTYVKKLFYELQGFYAKCYASTVRLSDSTCVWNFLQILELPLWGFSLIQWKARRCEGKAAGSM